MPKNIPYTSIKAKNTGILRLANKVFKLVGMQKKQIQVYKNKWLIRWLWAGNITKSNFRKFNIKGVKIKEQEFTKMNFLNGISKCWFGFFGSEDM